MLAYIPTRVTKRLRSHELARWLGLRPILVCDNVFQAEALLKQPYRIPLADIVVVPGVPRPPTGAAFKRDYVAREVAVKGEWLVWLDDNVSGFQCLRRDLTQSRVPVDDPLSTVNWRAEFSKPATKEEVSLYIHETIEEAEKRGTINCGFATEENYFFRGLKWCYFGYCRSQFTLYKNDGSGWLPYPGMMFEDMYKTVDVVARYGCVVVNRHLKPVKPLFESGGIGTLEERIPHLTENCRWLMEQYPSLLRLSKGRPYHVTFAKRSFATVNQWRREHGYL